MTENTLCKKYVGIPYLNQGRSFDGVDCWGLVILVYQEIGIKVLDLIGYDYNWAQKGDNLFIENYYEAWEKVQSPRYMDLLMFNNSHGIPYHAGIYLSDGRFIQCGLNVGVVITPLEKWEKRLYGIYRYKREQNK